MTTVFVRISSDSARISTDRLRRQLNLVFILLGLVLRLSAQLLDDREVHDLVEPHGRILDRADLAIEIVRLTPNSFEVGRIVLVEEELVVLGPIRIVGVAANMLSASSAGML